MTCFDVNRLIQTSFHHRRGHRQDYRVDMVANQPEITLRAGANQVTERLPSSTSQKGVSELILGVQRNRSRHRGPHFHVNLLLAKAGH